MQLSLDVWISLCAVFVGTVVLITFYLRRLYSYWTRRGVPQVQPTPIIGNFKDVLLSRRTIGDFLADLYNKTQGVGDCFGIYVFHVPHLIVRSPNLAKHILVKDHNIFTDRNILKSMHDPLAAYMLFTEKGEDWKIMRQKMSPIFSSGKLKAMLAHICQIGVNMQLYLDKQIQNNPDLECKEICAKYSTDVIAKCAFAINAHCFDNEQAKFREMGKLAFSFRWDVALQTTCYFFVPVVAKLLHFTVLLPEVATFMRDTFNNTLKIREKSSVKGNDVIDTILELKRNENFVKEVNFVGDKVVAQAGQFFLAGFETTSSTMAFALYELCLHPNIQEKLRKEVSIDLLMSENIYEEVMKMKYLHMVVLETLRKYPVLPFLDRRCNANYKIPNTEIILEKGTPVFIPIIAYQYDPEYFPNPDQFDPERFSEQNMPKVKPFSFLPFGEGPRICIGERFGLLATKLGIISVLSKYAVVPNNQTPRKLEFETRSFVLASKVGLPMTFQKI